MFVFPANANSIDFAPHNPSLWYLLYHSSVILTVSQYSLGLFGIKSFKSMYNIYSYLK